MKWTHVGYVVGCDARMPAGYRRKVLLRRTKTMWVGEHQRYTLRGITLPRERFPVSKLDVDTITEIEE